mgnify:CR=1 FL=1
MRGDGGKHSIIKKGEEQLEFLENKLGLAEKLKAVEVCAKVLKDKAVALELPSDFSEDLQKLTQIIKE